MRTFAASICGLLIVGVVAGPASAALVAGDIQYEGSFKIEKPYNPGLMAFVREKGPTVRLGQPARAVA